MTPKQFKNLKPGDFVRHKHEALGYVVHANFGDRVTAARTTDLTNPHEWDLVTEAGEVIEEQLTYKDGYYYFTAERSSFRAIAQCIGNEWFCVGEVGPISMAELERRGWRLEKRVPGYDMDEEDR